MLTSAEFVARMEQVGIEIRPMRSDELEVFTREERVRWANTIDALKVKIE